MPLVTPNIAIAIFLFILIISGIIAWRNDNYGNYDVGKFHTFIAILGGLGVFVTFMFYYNIVGLQQQQQTLAAIQEVSRIDDSLINSVLSEMQSVSNVVPNFVNSLNPLTNTVCCNNQNCSEVCQDGQCSILADKDAIDNISVETCTTKMVLSYRIFALWQDIIPSNKYVNFNAVSYISNFLQRANSPQLYKQWIAAKIDFNQNTQIFGDLLFEYGLPITDQTPDEYERVANLLISDSRFKAIFVGQEY